MRYSEKSESASIDARNDMSALRKIERCKLIREQWIMPGRFIYISKSGFGVAFRAFNKAIYPHHNSLSRKWPFLRQAKASKHVICAHCLIDGLTSIELYRQSETEREQRTYSCARVCDLWETIKSWTMWVCKS